MGVGGEIDRKAVVPRLGLANWTAYVGLADRDAQRVSGGAKPLVSFARNLNRLQVARSSSSPLGCGIVLKPHGAA